MGPPVATHSSGTCGVLYDSLEVSSADIILSKQQWRAWVRPFLTTLHSVAGRNSFCTDSVWVTLMEKLSWAFCSDRFVATYGGRGDSDDGLVFGLNDA